MLKVKIPTARTNMAYFSQVTLFFLSPNNSAIFPIFTRMFVLVKE